MNIKKELFSGSLSVSIITFIGHIFTAILKISISRLYGVEVFGVFTLINVTSRFLVSFVQLGYHQSMVYFVSKYHRLNEWGKISKIFKKGILGIIVSSILMTIVLFIFKTELNQIYFKNNNINVGMYIAGIMFVIAINNYISAILKGMKKHKEQAVIFTSLYPIIMVLSLIISLNQDKKPQIEVFYFNGILLNCIALIILIFWLNKKIDKKFISKKETPGINLTEYSVPVWISSVLRSGIGKADRIMLGYFASTDQVGVYGAGLTLSVLFSFPLKSLKPVLEPMIVNNFKDSKIANLNILFNTIIRWTSFYVFPIFGFLICFGINLLQIFGKDFSSGFSIMLVLCLSQIITTIFGATESFLNMTEKPKTNMKIIIAGAVITILLNILLIPIYGGFGAAIGTCISLFIINLLRLKAVKKLLKIEIDYSILLSLSLKFIPLLTLFNYIENLNILDWYYLALSYLSISIIFIYFSISKTEKKSVKKYLYNLKSNF